VSAVKLHAAVVSVVRPVLVQTANIRPVNFTRELVVTGLSFDRRDCSTRLMLLEDIVVSAPWLQSDQRSAGAVHVVVSGDLEDELLVNPFFVFACCLTLHTLRFAVAVDGSSRR